MPREYTGINALEWASRAEELGAGEIVLTSVDREGTGEGYDMELVKAVTKNVSIPVIVHGGAGKKEDVFNVIKEGAADAVTIASLFHYEYITSRKSEAATQEEGNVEFLKNATGFKKSGNHHGRRAKKPI